jgi:hypothetical protein
MSRLAAGLLLLAMGAGAGREDERPPSGLLDVVSVQLPTRLDWEYVSAAYGPAATRLGADYDTLQQRYQLFVPPASRKGQASGLVLFLSPGDDPLGWHSWSKVCEDNDVFFCAAYGAGDGIAPGRRVRVACDALDDVRRRHSIDPARTYVAGLGGGARLACTLAFSLPEYFGGVVAVGGGSATFRHDYLRHRARDRLSVAAVTGADDFSRAESEVFLHPLLGDLGVRDRLWVVPRLGHDLPPPHVLGEVWAWLEADLGRRRQDARLRPGLAVGPVEVPTRRVVGQRMLAEAEAELARPDHLSRGASLLTGLAARCERTDAADRARQMLRTLDDDPGQRQRLAEQGGREERQVLAAQARALDRLGRMGEALVAWEQLARSHADTPEGKAAGAEVRRLTGLREAAPYLGLHFEGETTLVRAVVPHGPAQRSGLVAGDSVQKLGAAATPSLAELRRALRARQPGDRLDVAVRRDGRLVTLTVVVGTTP